MTDEELFDLSYLLHDKAHVIVQGQTNAAVEYATTTLASMCNVNLYRGVSKEELQKIEAGNVDYYLSCSEDKSIASKFGEFVVTFVPLISGFNLYEHGIKELEKLRFDDQKEFEMCDGDFLIESYNEEKEWVLPFNTKFEKISDLVFKIIAL